MQRSPLPSPSNREPLPRKTYEAVGLCSCWNGGEHLTFQRGDAAIGSEHGVWKLKLLAVPQVGTAAHKALICLGLDRAKRTPAWLRSRQPAAWSPQRHALIDTGRDLHAEAVTSDHFTGAGALRARLSDDPARPAHDGQTLLRWVSTLPRRLPALGLPVSVQTSHGRGTVPGREPVPLQVEAEEAFRHTAHFEAERGEQIGKIDAAEEKPATPAKLRRSCWARRSGSESTARASTNSLKRAGASDSLRRSGWYVSARLQNGLLMALSSASRGTSRTS